MKTFQTSKELKKRFYKIHQCFAKLRKNFSSKDIHNFRLQVKKLKALLLLANVNQKPARFLRLSKKLRAFYKEVGIARTLQIQQQRVRDTALNTKSEVLPNQYLKIVKDKITRSIECARGIAEGKAPFKKGAERLTSMATGKLTMAARREFMWKEATSLKNLTDSLYSSDEALHSARKLVKDLLFVWPTIRSEAMVILPSVILSTREDLQFISKRLGKFQDACCGLDLLQEIDATQMTNEKERSFLSTLEKNWSKEKDTLRHEIHQLFLKRIPAQPTFTLLPDGNEIKDKLLAVES